MRSDKDYDVEGDDDAFQTDDERVYVNVDNDEDDESTESETSSPYPNSSPNCLQLNHSPSWPQSYRFFFLLFLCLFSLNFHCLELAFCYLTI